MVESGVSISSRVQREGSAECRSIRYGGGGGEGKDGAKLREVAVGLMQVKLGQTSELLWGQCYCTLYYLFSSIYSLLL